MSKKDKSIDKIFSDSTVSYGEAESILFHLNFALKISGSHHIFRKSGYAKNISLKKRERLLEYQKKMLRDILKDHGYEK